MTAKTLEQEARELYKVIISAMKPETPRYTEIGEQIAEFQFVQGYIAAATARDKGAHSLRDARVVVRQLVEWAEEEGCDCGQNDPPCALCVGKAFLGGDQ